MEENEKKKDEGKIIQVSQNMLDLIEKLRETIKTSTSGALGDNLSYIQLTDILAKKFIKNKIEFKFP